MCTVNSPLQLKNKSRKITIKSTKKTVCVYRFFKKNLTSFCLIILKNDYREQSLLSFYYGKLPNRCFVPKSAASYLMGCKYNMAKVSLDLSQVFLVFLSFETGQNCRNAVYRNNLITLLNFAQQTSIDGTIF